MFIVPLTSNITPIEPASLKPKAVETTEEKQDYTFLYAIFAIFIAQYVPKSAAGSFLRH